ncbi:AAA family ATPase [Achromobacter spanius]|uniref:AAA family ATPase n=1 Tax=Achromobacter spanius TaxID=217203 RepID=UPI003800647B
MRYSPEVCSWVRLDDGMHARRANPHFPKDSMPQHFIASCHVITGASGAGKSTLLAALSDLGYCTVPEAALAILREQQACNGTLLPWTDRAAFLEAVLERNISNHQAAQSMKAPVFFDRGIPECLAWLRMSGVPLQSHHLAAPEQYRYAPTVFVAEPWPEVYVQTAERHASFEQAARSYDATVNAYVDAGYSPCILPKVPVQERVAFVLDRMAPSSAENKKPAEQ